MGRSSSRHGAFIRHPYGRRDQSIPQGGIDDFDDSKDDRGACSALGCRRDGGRDGVSGDRTRAAHPEGVSFRPQLDSRHQPLVPVGRGSVYVYEGQKDGKQARDVMTVTQKTKVIAGIRRFPSQTDSS